MQLKQFISKNVISFTSMGLVLFSIPAVGQTQTCTNYPDKLQGQVRAQIDLRAQQGWLMETAEGQITFTKSGSSYKVDTFEGEAEVRGHWQGCFVQGSTRLSKFDTFGSLFTNAANRPTKVSGQIDLFSRFVAFINCPGRSGNQYMNHLGPLLATGHFVELTCDADNLNPRLIGNTVGRLTNGARAVYQWDLQGMPADTTPPTDDDDAEQPIPVPASI